MEKCSWLLISGSGVYRFPEATDPAKYKGKNFIFCSDNTPEGASEKTMASFTFL